jgi:hypothetical protein
MAARLARIARRPSMGARPAKTLFRPRRFAGTSAGSGHTTERDRPSALHRARALATTRATTAASFLRSMSPSAAVARAAPSQHAEAVARRLGRGGGIRGCRARPTRTALTLTRTATGRDAASGGSGADEEGTFREFHRDERGRVIDSDGNPVAAPENGWVAEMEKEWAATGYDERFFDDDWDEINPANVNAENAEKPNPEPVFPFKDIKDSEWRETVTWEDEAADDALYVESGPAAGPGPIATTPPPNLDPSPAHVVRGKASANDVTGHVRDHRHPDDPDASFHDLTEAQEAAIMGFASGLDAGDGDDEPEGPPAVLLAGFRAEEIPRVRELLDELGGHDVPVVPVAQTYLERRLIDALKIPEPDWESPRSDATFGVRGGDFGSRRCVVFSGLDRGEMAIIVSAIESRGLPRLVTAVVTSENCEKSLGEALALAVRDARSDARRKEETSLKSAADLEAAMRAVDAAAAAETLSAADLVQREIDRQDALAADEAAALNARNERATRAERHMEKLKQEYVERARARAAAEAAIGNAPGEDPNPAGWPTLENVEASAAKAENLNVDDVLRASGADGDALEAMVREALRESERASASGAEKQTEKTAAPKKKGVGADDEKDPLPDAQENRTPPLEAVEGYEVEIDPTRWSERVDASVRRETADVDKNASVAAREKTDAEAFDEDENGEKRSSSVSGPIGEPSAAQPNPLSSRRGVRDAAAAGPPPERAGETEPKESGREVVEPQVMTRRMLRELAMRRGVSYAELLARAEAEGLELPEE